MEKSFKRKCIEFFAHRKQKSEALDKNKQPFLAALCMAGPATIISIPAYIIAYCICRNIEFSLIVAGVVWVIIYIADLIVSGRCKSILKKMNEQEAQKVREADVELQRKIRFYKECQANGVTDITDTFDRKKAELIAQRLGCRYNDIEQYYREVEIAASQNR